MARRDPSFYARWCRKECGLEDAERIDLEEVACAREVKVYSAPTDSFEGAAMVVEGVAAVCLNEDQIPQRYRFTFGHELGHLFLPWHYRLLIEGRQMIDKVVTWGAPADGIEREANSFAAELLTPSHLVEPYVAHGSIDASRAIAVADTFDISRTSAALRIVEVSREPVAVLLFRQGRLAWRFQNERFPYGVPVSGLRPPADSATADLVRGGDDLLDAVEVDGACWFVDRRYGGVPATLESCVRLGNTGDILTILWSPE
jgi:Zn-dependent peptidase ImmA (M78 family)